MSGEMAMRSLARHWRLLHLQRCLRVHDSTTHIKIVPSVARSVELAVDDSRRAPLSACPAETSRAFLSRVLHMKLLAATELETPVSELSRAPLPEELPAEPPEPPRSMALTLDHLSALCTVGVVVEPRRKHVA